MNIMGSQRTVAACIEEKIDKISLEIMCLSMFYSTLRHVLSLICWVLTCKDLL